MFKKWSDKICLNYEKNQFISLESWKHHHYFTIYFVMWLYVFLYLASTVQICAMKLTHIGENYPCLMDPNKGTTTSQNSSSVKVSIYNATMSFMQLANYGKFFLLQSTKRFSHVMIYLFLKVLVLTIQRVLWMRIQSRSRATILYLYLHLQQQPSQ